MKRVVFLVSLLALVATAFGAVADKAPCAATTPYTPLPAFGDTIRSFTMTSGPTYPGGVAATADGYVISGHWGSLFTAWYVYTTTGSFVRSVAISGMTGYGFRGGSAGTHLGSGYFGGAFLSGGLRAYTYTAGGTPGTTFAQISTGPTGRGIAYNGTYYYGTNGSYGAPIGYYTTAGSLVGTVPIGGTLLSYCYDYATPSPSNGYIYVTNQSPNSIVECSLSTGSQTRSISVPSTFPAGADIRMADGYLYTTIQLSSGVVIVYDVAASVGIAPSSLGKVKSLYR